MRRFALSSSNTTYFDSSVNILWTGGGLGRPQAHADILTRSRLIRHHSLLVPPKSPEHAPWSRTFVCWTTELAILIRLLDNGDVVVILKSKGQLNGGSIRTIRSLVRSEARQSISPTCNRKRGWKSGRGSSLITNIYHWNGYGF